MVLADWLWVCGVFAVLLVVLATWERRIDRRHSRLAVAEIREARERGTNQAIAQHPTVEPLLCIGCASCAAACPEDGVLGLVDGIAHVIHASRCVGHGRCEAACPVGAITVGLGDVSKRPDIPILRENFETTVPGIYIAGELGGIALIRNAVDHGVRTVADIARRVKTEGRGEPDVVDLLIVGAGPAGLSASLKAIECGLRYVTIDQDDAGGTIRKYPRRKLTLVQPVEIPLFGRLKGREYPKEELLEMWEGIIRKCDVAIQRPAKLQSIRGQRGDFLAQTSDGAVRSRYVVLAMGRRGTPRKLGVPGEEGEKVLYQLIDAATYTGQKILVVGGGDSAIEAATGLANQPGNAVTISYRKHDFFRLKPRNEQRIREYVAGGRIEVVFNSAVKEIRPDSVTIEVASPAATGGALREIANDYVFVFAGGDPPYPLLRETGIGFGADGSSPDASRNLARATS
jgi:thioredoxin reductase (NADPH)